MTLTVPRPALTVEAVTPPRFPAEKPITLVCEPVTFPDGALLLPENAVEFGFLLYQQEAGGGTMVWDEATQSWVPEATGPDPQPLFHQENRWQSILVAIGLKDKNNQDKFGSDPSTGFPKYFVRCFFRGIDAQGLEHTGGSPDSEAVEVVKFGERHRAGLATDVEDLAQATEIRLFLKDAARIAERGRIIIREEAGEFIIELIANGASMTLTRNGDILLQPGHGRRVQIEGDVRVSGNLTADNLP